MSKLTIEITQSYKGQAIELLGETELHIDIEYSHLLSRVEFESMPYTPADVAIARMDKDTSIVLQKGLVGKGYTITIDNKVYKDNIKDDYDIMFAEFADAVISHAISKRLYWMSDILT